MGDTRLRADVSDRIRAATAKRIQKYEEIKGKQIRDFPFWDIIVIGAGDNSQKEAYELQLTEKLGRNQLPLGVDYCVVPDASVGKSGGGGSMFASLQSLKATYGNALTTKKVLLIPAGGYSSRLPNASLLGKIFMSVPLGDPLYEMFELTLALTIDFPAKMAPGVFLVASDCCVLYDDEDSQGWVFNPIGVTAIGHPSSLDIGLGHGVFVSTWEKGPTKTVEITDVLQFLHKPSAKVMKEKEAILPGNFTSSIGEAEEMVLTDSFYYMDLKTALKLHKLYLNESPLSCEIDCHGDFLQPLGPRATMDYIQDTSNICKVTDSLSRMRRKIFDTLNGTPFSVAVMKHSRFYHLGTMNEYLDHMCKRSLLFHELGLSSPEYKVNCNNGNPSDGSSEKRLESCVMNSIGDFKVEDRCVVEHCNFKIPTVICSNSIISSSFIGDCGGKQPVVIPSDTFLYTACISNVSYQKQYITVSVGIQDDLKKVVPPGSFGELSIFGKSFEEICGSASLDQTEHLLFPIDTPRSLWYAKLFLPAPTMEEAFSSLMDLVEKFRGSAPWQPNAEWAGRMSMHDLIKDKYVFGMIKFRKELQQNSATK